MEPLVAIYDSCVLYPNFLRDFLVRLAIHGRGAGLLRIKWTGRIHREWIGAVLRQRPELRQRCAERASSWIGTCSDVESAGTNGGSSA